MDNSATTSRSGSTSEDSEVFKKKRKVDHTVEGSIVKVELKNFM